MPGTLTRANLVRPPCFTRTARFMLRFEIYGNGWPGSKSGVSTGKMWVAKYCSATDPSRACSRSARRSVPSFGAAGGAMRPARRLQVHLLERPLSDRGEPCSGIQSVDRDVVDVGAKLLENRRDPDHEELVQVRGRDRETSLARVADGRSPVLELAPAG